MTRPLAEIEAERELRRKHAEVLGRLQEGGGLTVEQQQVEQELLQAISEEIAAIGAKNAPPPLPPAVPGIEKISPAEAAERAAGIRKDPRYWDPRKADEKGVRLTSAEHELLVRQHSELLGRAAEPEQT